jgi:hypothetical protein
MIWKPPLNSRISGQQRDDVLIQHLQLNQIHSERVMFEFESIDDGSDRAGGAGEGQSAKNCSNLQSSQAELGPSRSTQRFDGGARSRTITWRREHRLRWLGSQFTGSSDGRLSPGRHGGGAEGQDAIWFEEGGVESNKTSRAESGYIVKQNASTSLALKSWVNPVKFIETRR